MIITNLFSIFDPSLRLFSFSWGTLVMCVLILPSFFWSRNYLKIIFNYFSNMVKKEINYVIKNYFKGCYSFIRSIFIIIGLNNLIALFPHFFSPTSHLVVTLPFSYCFWLCVVIFTWINFLKNSLAHLIPVGTPFSLIRFIVIVELLRNVIRPLALTFRLTANIIAGHLLISLVGRALVGMPFILTTLGSSLIVLLVFIELGVSLIQSYVFSTLILLYLSERNH